MKVSYYPGCSLHGTAKEYDQSVRAVSRTLGIDLEEIEDWSCCGASSAHSHEFQALDRPAGPGPDRGGEEAPGRDGPLRRLLQPLQDGGAPPPP